MKRIDIRILGAPDRAALNAFLTGCTEATVFHRPEWHEAIEATYGHPCMYWGAVTDEGVVGAFPVVHMRFLGVGCKAVALPYQMYAGVPLASDDSVRVDLLKAAAGHARELGARYFEIRHHRPSSWLQDAGFTANPSGVVTTAVALTDASPKRIEHGHRQRIRKAEQQGLTIVESDRLEDLRAFRRLYMKEMRALGAPQAGWRFFENLHRNARGFYQLLLAQYAGQTIGGMLSVGDNNIMFSRCSATASAEARALNAGPALWWRAIADARARGCHAYNCGMSWSGDHGLIKWKESWGGETYPIHIYALPMRGSAPAPGDYFSKYGVAKAVWRRLPMPVVEFAGQIVTRWVG